MLNPFQRKSLAESLRKRSLFPKQLERHDTTDKPSIIKVFEYVGGGELKKTYKGYITLCIFHDDDKPSLALYPTTNTYFCFACESKGDSYKMLMEQHALTFPQAIQAAKDNYLYDR